MPKNKEREGGIGTDKDVEGRKEREREGEMEVLSV